MENLKTLLVANRGEIATRILKTAKRLHLRTIAIYTEADAASSHVTLADKAVLLLGPDAKAYLDGDQIIKIAKENNVDAIIPGYGFLSENTEFAKAVISSKVIWIGPRPESINDFGLKHIARALAVKAHVPVVPGTEGLLTDEDHAVEESNRLGFPVILKATAGGGGLGLATCKNVDDVRGSFKTVKSRGENLFKDAGIFIERFYPNSHHIEVQVFGNGQGDVIHFGERECSIQRRHQKIIEECPSPLTVKFPGLREKLCNSAVRLAESIKYESAGTIEYLVDDETREFFFLEMNTRLQVEHGVTELCYDVDLVELMLRQADAKSAGRSGLDIQDLKSFRPKEPSGFAIEARVYAENPARDYVPSPGTLQIVEWEESNARIDTWVKTGTVISSHYDPLLAKVMFHSTSRESTIRDMQDFLRNSRICGPPTNLEFLGCILEDPKYVNGRTLTNFLDSFEYSPNAIDVISGGAHTTIQDWPGRPTMGRGFPQAGPMDPLAFRIANLLVGNPPGQEGLEITLEGPELHFLGDAVIALCGAPMELYVDGNSIPMWTKIHVTNHQKLKIGRTTGGGCRSYLAIYGGFLNVAEWFGSKATSSGVGVGGYQGRALRAGDFLATSKALPNDRQKSRPLAPHLVPGYPNHWDILAMVGPYEDGYLLKEDVEMIYHTKWQLSHNAARGGIRLIGPKPKWARKDGGEGGAHPSNLIEYGYPIGALNWTGDDPCIFPVDCPDFGGFVSSTTIVKADFWKMGQMKAGDTMQFHRTSLRDALALREKVDDFVDEIGMACSRQGSFDGIAPLDYSNLPPSALAGDYGKAVVYEIQAKDDQPRTRYRQGADDYLLVEYGDGALDLNHRCRVTALAKSLKESDGDISFSRGLTNTVGCCCSLLISYDGTMTSQKRLIAHLVALEAQLGDLSSTKVPSRLFKLPITFENSRQAVALQRYMETQRPYASYLPDNMEFVAKNNGLTRKELENIFLTSKLIAVTVGFFAALPLCLPVDPRQRINCPKMNPSRNFTPEGQVSWGGSCMALYNIESPGGYQLTGLSIPGVDILGSKTGYSLDRPWLFEDFDQLTFYEVGEEEYERQLALFHSGRYEYQWEEVTFDMAEHNDLLRRTKGEVELIRQRQKEAQETMSKVEKELMGRWTEGKARGKMPMNKVEALLTDPSISTISSPLNANVWKVLSNEGEVLESGSEAIILEAMKMEITIKAEERHAGCKIERILVRPNDTVKAGDALVLLRNRS